MIQYTYRTRKCEKPPEGSYVMTYEERKAQVNYYLGKDVHVVIDRPVGYVHKKEKYTLTYPINYGYIPGVIGGDGEELDVYVLGVTEPIGEFSGRVIGIVNREDDVEDKLVAAPVGTEFDQAEIAAAVHFQEQYYKTKVECVFRRSCGAVVYRRRGDGFEYLLLLQKRSQTWSFPKGTAEPGESETVTAMREIGEEAGYTPQFMPDFRVCVRYRLTSRIEKEVVLFLAEVSEEPNIRQGEIEQYRWVSANEAVKLLYGGYGEVLNAAERYLCKQNSH